MNRRVRMLLRWGAMAAIVVGLVWMAQFGFFVWRSHVVGTALVQREAAKISPAAPSSTSAQLASIFRRHPTVSGILEIPALHLKAPVVQGVGNSPLSVAIGHLPTSVWPGSIGTSILAAHNATWFRHLNRLAVGAQIRYVTPTRTLVFRLTGQQVVHTGTPVYNSAGATLVLESCYPLNALYLTPYRLLASARLVQTQPAVKVLALPTAVQYHFTLPAEMSAADLTFAKNDAPMGTLTETGTPALAWQQSASPLNAVSAATQFYFAVLREANAGSARQWARWLPTVPWSAVAALAHAHITTYYQALNVTLRVHNRTMTRATVTTQVAIQGGPHPGRYQLQGTLAVSGSTLRLVRWRMRLL